MSLSRKAAATAAALSLAGIGICLTSTAAQAEPLSQSCLSTSTLDFDPGLNLAQPQTGVQITGTGSLNGCLSQVGASGLTATYTVSGTVNGTCLLGTIEITQQITWNNGQSSTVTFSGPSVGVVGNVLEGTVQSGLFAGNTVAFPNVLATTLLANPTACVDPGGLKQAQGTGDEVFTSVL